MALRPWEIEHEDAPQLPWAKPAACTLKRGKLHFTWTRNAAMREGVAHERVRLLEVNPAVMIDSSVWEAFIGLADREDEEIRRFAEKYGPLECIPGKPGFLEDLAEWRRYSALGKAIARAGFDLLMREVGKQSDRNLISAWCFGEPSPARSDVRDRKALIAFALDKWLSGRCQPGVRWTGDYIRDTLTPTGVLGLVGLQIRHALGGAGRMEKCAGCGAMFTPERLATTGVRRYCIPCRKRKIPTRDSMRDMRARRKAPRARPENATHKSPHNGGAQA